MNEKQIQSILKNLAEQKAPGSEINLWPSIEPQLQASDRTNLKGTVMDNRKRPIPRIVAAVTLAAALIAVIFFLTPQGQAFAQDVLRFFTRAESNQFPPIDMQEASPLSVELRLRTLQASWTRIQKSPRYARQQGLIFMNPPGFQQASRLPELHSKRKGKLFVSSTAMWKPMAWFSRRN